jgi:hypothetical protein
MAGVVFGSSSVLLIEDVRQLIELPPRDVELLKLEFTPDERAIYHMVCAAPSITIMTLSKPLVSG